MVKKTIFCALVAALLLLSCGGDTMPENPAWDTASPLHEAYTDEFLMGNIVRSADAADLSGVRFNILKYHFNSATAENHMKPDYIAPLSSTGNYRFTDADKILAAAIAAELKMHGHTLIWHDQTPGWLTDGNKDTILANLEKYVTDVVTHFKGKVTTWDVVNEAINSSGLTLAMAADWKNCIRPTSENGWYKAGSEYIEKAFLAARAADPDALLYYNDFNMNNTGADANALETFVNPKTLATYNMIKDINERYPNVGGRPLIDGIGMQSHHHIRTTPESVESSIIMFSKLGLDIHISELDIVASDGGSITGYGAWNEKASKTQAERYALFFEIFKKYSENISRVTFWGLDDGTSWRGANHATLLDSNYGLKPAFFAVQDPDAYLPQD